MFLSVFIKAYIYNQAKKLGINFNKNIKGILEESITEYSSYNKRIIFSYLWDGGSRVPNASATIPGVILVNAEWAARIVLYANDKEIHNAFKQTIGHELTHQENDYFFLEPFTKNEKFVYWINEIHADFGGVIKAFDGDVELGISALRYKQKSKIKKDNDSFTHPSWQRRITFLTDYDFDEKLMRDVAQIVGCNNEKLINKVCSHFEKITLCKKG